MPTAYERHLIVSYLANTAARLHHRDSVAATLVEWLIDREHPPTFASERLLSRFQRAIIDVDDGMSARKLRCLQQALRDESTATKRVKQDLAARRLRRLAETTGLNRTDVDILELLLRYETQPTFEAMVDYIFLRSPVFERLVTRTLKGSMVPAFLGVSVSTVRDRLADNSPLVRTGLMSIDRNGGVTIVNRLRRLATVPACAGLDANRLLLDAAPASELEWSDFDHIADDRDHVERLLRGSLDSSVAGVNILLHGPAGDRQDGVLQGARRAARRDPLQRRRDGRRGRRAQPPRAAAGAPTRSASACARPAVAHPLRRDGGSAVRLGDRRYDPLWAADRLGRSERRLQSLHARTAGAGTGANALDDERRPFGQRDAPAPHDVRAGAPPTNRIGQGADLGAAARAPRDRSRA